MGPTTSENGRSTQAKYKLVMTYSRLRPLLQLVHWYRNIFSHVPSTKVREIAAMLRRCLRRSYFAGAEKCASTVGTTSLG